MKKVLFYLVCLSPQHQAPIGIPSRDRPFLLNQLIKVAHRRCLLEVNNAHGYSGACRPGSCPANAFATDIITQLPEEFQTRAKPALDKDARDAFLGFDPMTAAGWSTVGIDAVAALALRRIIPSLKNVGPRPLVFLKLTDRAKLIAAFKAKGVAITFTDQKGPSEVMTVAGVQSSSAKRVGTPSSYLA